MDDTAYLTETPQGRYCIYSRIRMLDANYNTIDKCFREYHRDNYTFYPKEYKLIDRVLYRNNAIHSRVIGVLNLPLTRENNPEYFV